MCHRCHACTAYHNGVADTIGVSLQQCPWVINKERAIRQTQAHLAYDEPEPDARMESTSQHLGRSGFPGVKPRYPGRADYMGAAPSRPRSSASQQSKPGSANSSKRVIEDVIVAALENAGVKEVPAQDIGSLWDTLNADGSGTPASDGEADRVDEEGNFNPDGELLLLDYRQGDAELFGAEAETRFTVLDTGAYGFGVRAFGDLVRGRLRDSD